MSNLRRLKVLRNLKRYNEPYDQIDYLLEEWLKPLTANAFYTPNIISKSMYFLN
jgi:hypothetical protein